MSSRWWIMRVRHTGESIADQLTVNPTWQDGASPVFVASQNGHLEVVRLLIAASADVKAAMNVSFVTSRGEPEDGSAAAGREGAHLAVRPGVRFPSCRP